MEQYTVLGKIGCGKYGDVYLVKSRENDTRYALKCHKNNNTEDDDTENDTASVEEEETVGISESTVRELSCLSALSGHAHVVEILDCFLHKGRVATLMPYFPYTLYDVIYGDQYPGLMCRERIGPTPQCPDLMCHEQCILDLPIPFIARFSLEIADALSFIHGLNMVHRDLKPANVLLTADTLTVKVADMGLSRYAVAKGMSSTVVTQPYRAPELFNAKYILPYTCAIDLWSLGVTIVDAMEGKMVFFHSEVPITELEAITGQKKSNSTNYPKLNRVMPNVMKHTDVRKIVLNLLHIDPRKRLTAQALLSENRWRLLSASVTPEILRTVKAYAGLSDT